VALWGAYTEVGFYCPRFRDIHGVGASNCGYSRACPVPYQFAPPHCVIRCCVVFMASQVLHRFVSVSLTAARSSLVGMRSWITIYHVDRWTPEIHAVWRLVHRRFQFTSGYLRTIRITSLLSVLLCMSLSVPYIRLLCLLMVSFACYGAIYAMSSAYWRTCTSLLGILLMCGGFSTVSVMFHFHKKAAVAETFRAASVLMLPRRSARHFRTMSCKAHPPNSSGR